MWPQIIFNPLFIENKRLRFKLDFLTSLYLLSIILSLFIRSLVPLRGALQSPHDDQLGIELSSNILQGEWLGAWNNRTLAKPPGYSLYLSLTHFIPIPLVILNHILYILVVLLLIIKIKRLTLISFKFAELTFFGMFSYMIFQPILFSTEASRAYRSSVSSMVLTMLYSVILMSLIAKISNFETLSRNTMKERRDFYLDIIGLTLVYSVMSLFRYESFWILFCSIPVLLISIAIRLWKSFGNRLERGRFLRLLLPAPLIVIIIYFTPIFTIQELNRSAFGVRLTENFYQGDFANAVNLWASVDAGRDPRPYIVVSNQQRSAVYEVSKNARLMKPFLESPDNGWNKPACDILRLCDNAGAWFTWQVRDAAVSTGLVYSERTFQRFFGEIAIDIQNACDRAAFRCTRKSNLVGSKPLGELPVKRIKDFSIANLSILVPFKANNLHSITKPDTYGAPENVAQLFHEVVHYNSASSYDDKQLERTSKILKSIGTFYLPFNLLIYFFALLGVVTGCMRGLILPLKLILLFLFGGIISQVLGTSIAQISFGYPPGSYLYLLSAYPMVHMAAILGLMSLISRFSKKEQVVSLKSPTNTKAQL